MRNIFLVYSSFEIPSGLQVEKVSPFGSEAGTYGVP